MRMTSDSSVLKFTLKELDDLVNDVNSQVYLKKDVKYPLNLTPACLQNVNQAIAEILSTERLKYIPKYKGLLLAYKHVRRTSDMGAINNDSFNILIYIDIDLYIFAPEIGCTMTGIATKVSEDSVACLVHKGFNVTLPRPRNEEMWIGSSVKIGDQVKFQLDTFNVVGTLPYIRGVLLSHVAVKQEPGEAYVLPECGLRVVVNGKKRKFEELEEPSPDTVTAKKERNEDSDAAETGEEVVERKAKKKKRNSHPVAESLTESEAADSTMKKISSSFETGEAVIEKKAKKKKRKSDLVPESLTDSETADSTKKKSTSLSSTTGHSERPPLKGSLLKFLLSENEDDCTEDESQAAISKDTKKTKKKSKVSPLKQDLVLEKSDVSAEALLLNVTDDIGDGTRKTTEKSNKSNHFELRENGSIEASPLKKLKTPKSLEKTAGKGKKTAGLNKSLLLEGKSEEDSFDLGTKLLKSNKKNKLSVQDSPTVEEPTSGKKRKSKAGEKANVTAEEICDVSVEGLSGQATVRVNGKTPKKTPSKNKASSKHEKSADLEAEFSTDIVRAKDTVKYPNVAPTSGARNSSGLVDFQQEDLSPQITAEALGKQKKKKAKLSAISNGTDQSPSKSASKSKSRPSLADSLLEDVNLPTSAELIGTMQEGLVKSHKKSKKIKR